jgi:hypothetical protein
MTDDAAAFQRRCDLIAGLEADAIENAKTAPKLSLAAERLLALAEEIQEGRRQTNPEARRMARVILERAERINRERGET